MTDELILLALMLVASAFFSGSEIGLVKLSRARIRELIRKGGRASRGARMWDREPERVIMTINVGNNIANVAGASLGTIICIRVFASLTMEQAAQISTLGMTLALLIFGEVTPKTIANRYPYVFTRVTLPILHLLSFVFAPIHHAVWPLTNAIVRVITGDRPAPSTQPDVLTADLAALAEIAREHGALDAHQSRMVRGVVDLGARKVQEIMVPRVRMARLAVDASRDEILRTVKASQHTRIPVYEGDLDHMVGILHARDLLRHMDDKVLDLRRLVRSVHFVPEMISARRLLQRMQRESFELAMVINEYGAVEGLVTLEDVLEEIVGELGEAVPDARPPQARPEAQRARPSA